MDFIFLQAFWLLPIVALPIIFNIINNRKFKTVNFSAIRFIESLKTDSIKKMNIINLLLLILRILIILFLILTISRPIIKSEINSSLNNASSLRVVVLIDDSYSNLNKDNYDSQIKKIKMIISQISNQYQENTNIEISSINQGSLYSGLLGGLDASKINISYTYKSGEMWPLMESYFSKNKTNSYLNGDMYIITDMAESSFSGLDKEDWWDLAFINIAPTDRDPEISKLEFSRDIIVPSQKFNIDIAIVNSSDNDFYDITAHLYLDKEISFPKKFDIKSNSEKKVTFEDVSCDSDCSIYVELKKEQKKLGQTFFSKLRMSPRINLGFLKIEESETRMFLSTAAKSIKIDRLNVVDVDLNYSNLRALDIVVSEDPDILESPELIKYLKRGGHIAIFPNTNDENHSISLNGQAITLKREDNNYFIEKDNIVNEKLRNQIFKDGSEDLLFNVKQGYMISANSNSIIQINDKSLWNRYYVGEGLVDLFGFNLNIRNSDFSIKAPFIPFVHNLLLSNQSKIETIKIENDLIDDLFAPQALFPMVLKKDSTELRQIDFYARNLRLNEIDSPGYYSLTSIPSNGRTVKEYIANISSSEIKYKEINYSILDSLFNDNMYRYNGQGEDFSGLGELISKKVKGFEIWHILLLIAISLFILESLIVNIYQRRL